MCGIAGVLYFDRQRKPDPGALARMNAAIAHRGPDGEGFYEGRGVGLAHRRLSIIDLPGGKQPMSNEAGDVWVVFNGEIFNYRELRPDLEKRGHRFATSSDTEVIVHLYEDLGAGCMEKLRGQFAIAIWDEKKRELLLARDRIGQKPLYYYRDAEKLVFASEMKAIFAFGDLELTLDEGVLREYLSFGYLAAPRTQFKEIHKLEPGQTLVVRDENLTFRRYWVVPFPQDEGIKISEGEALRLLEEKILESVRLRLIADVPLGAFLSGGVDSSLIVALMSRLHSGPVKTFNIAFAESSFDESKYAKIVARHLGTDHHEIPVDYRIDDLLDDVLAHFDEPFADSSAIPTYLVSKATRQHVKVALSGDAGDEFFFGYQRYAVRKLMLAYNAMPSAAHDLIGLSAKILGGDPTKGVPHGFWNRVRRFQKNAQAYTDNPESTFVPFFDDQAIHSLLGEDLYAKQSQLNPLHEFFVSYPQRHPVLQMAYAEQRHYLPDDILVKVDRMSMANALEVRSPLLDHKLVEWVAELPMRFKLRGITGKVLLRKLAAKYVPREVIDRPKQGFALPIPKWFRGELRQLLADRLLGSSQDLLNREATRRLFDAHQRGAEDLSQQLWSLLALQATFHLPKLASSAGASRILARSI